MLILSKCSMSVGAVIYFSLISAQLFSYDYANL